MEDLDKIFTKNYAELTDAEKSEISELCDDEYGFNALKVVFTQTNVLQNSRQAEIKNDPKTKENLDFLFHQKYQNKGILWYNSILAVVHDESKAWYNQRWMKVAAMIVVLLSIYRFIPQTEKQNAVLTAEVKKEEEKTEEPTVKSQKKSSSFSAESKGSADVTKNTAAVMPVGSKSKEKLDGDYSYSRAEDLFEPVAVPVAYYRATDASTESIKVEKNKKSELSPQEKMDLLDLLTPTF